MAGIATGAQEQSVGLGEINVGVTQLDQVTQQNAAMVEEATAAGMALDQEAEALERLVSSFRVRRGAGPATQPMPGRSARPDDWSSARGGAKARIRARNVHAAE
ncbi:hypothetical protein NHN26_14065, partial [Rhodovulum tesquicola]|nr:hypothetical protein [Rhodovulum tesquicola]